MKLQNKQESANGQEGPCGAACGKPLHFILGRGLSSPYTVPGAWSAPFLAPKLPVWPLFLEPFLTHPGQVSHSSSVLPSCRHPDGLISPTTVSAVRR